MKVVFRVDASVHIGSGHVMRCMTLALKLRESGAEVTFISRETAGHLCDYIERNGFLVHRIKPHSKAVENEIHVEWDAQQTIFYLQSRIAEGEASQALFDWLVVDHYSLDHHWEQAVQPYTRKMAVIDDLANRAHICDLLLDQNLYANMQKRYSLLVPSHCIQLLGPQYVLLRDEFLEERSRIRIRDGKVKRIFVFFGGSDPTNETIKALHAIQLLNIPTIEVDVIVGSSNPFLEEITKTCSDMPYVQLHLQVNNIAELMSLADLALGAGGSTTWERSMLGLPCITIVTAQNQLEMTLAIEQLGAIWNLGWYYNVKVNDILDKIVHIIENPIQSLQTSQKALQLMDPFEGVKAMSSLMRRGIQ
jgi:UDP-2,4-diacetamido-2,4,6-trideoxy-beta-L-altropyranose hydrolase